MKHIKILGTGCPKCKQTETVVRQAVDELGVEATIEKVEDIMQIMAYNVLSTPAVVIDGEVKIKGRVPTAGEVRGILTPLLTEKP
ncbi:MAG: TM0996/MTH895 family glutaredoxin-like protein [Phaeodactylibacter sp.]|nr:TM0996/MTH895 family glutaredoxin-like protein [Phaeodactylibacter sp.]